MPLPYTMQDHDPKVLCDFPQRCRSEIMRPYSLLLPSAMVVAECKTYTITFALKVDGDECEGSVIYHGGNVVGAGKC